MRCFHRRAGCVLKDDTRPDPFDAIDALLEKNPAAALDRLLDRAANSIRGPFDADLNHAWYIVGDIYFRQGEVTAAQDCFLKSLDARSDDADTMMALASCALERGDAAESERYLRAALRRSESANLLYTLGTTLLDQGKFGEALCYFKRVSPSDSELYPMAQRNLDRCHAMRRDR